MCAAWHQPAQTALCGGRHCHVDPSSDIRERNAEWRKCVDVRGAWSVRTQNGTQKRHAE